MMLHISGCGGIKQPIAHRAYWELPVAYGRAGTPRGEVRVDRQKEGPETPTSMQLMPHHGVFLGLRTFKEDTPCEGSRSIMLIDGGYRQNLE